MISISTWGLGLLTLFLALLIAALIIFPGTVNENNSAAQHPNSLFHHPAPIIVNGANPGAEVHPIETAIFVAPGTL